MFNPIFAKNFLKKCIFRQIFDIRFQLILVKLTYVVTERRHEFIDERFVFYCSWR